MDLRIATATNKLYFDAFANRIRAIILFFSNSGVAVAVSNWYFITYRKFLCMCQKLNF